MIRRFCELCDVSVDEPRGTVSLSHPNGNQPINIEARFSIRVEGKAEPVDLCNACTIKLLHDLVDTLFKKKAV